MRRKELYSFTRTSVFSGKRRTMVYPVYPDDLERYQNGEFVQNAFPYLSDDEREFILNGTTPEEWKRYVPPEE